MTVACWRHFPTTTYAVTCADDPGATGFLLASLTAQGDETAFLLPAGEWATRLCAALLQ